MKCDQDLIFIHSFENNRSNAATNLVVICFQRDDVDKRQRRRRPHKTKDNLFTTTAGQINEML